MNTTNTMPPRSKRNILDEAKQQKICEILSLGGTRKIAALCVGCHVDTIRRTALRNPAFDERLRKAQTGPEVGFLKDIQEAAEDGKNWRAAAWALERLYPERYGRRDATVLTVERVSDVLTRFASAILDDVPDRYRQKILKRMARLTASLPGAAEAPEVLAEA